MDRESSLMYGYLRKELLGDHQTQIERQLSDLAVPNGLDLADIHLHEATVLLVSNALVGMPEHPFPRVQCGNRLVLDARVECSGMVMPMSVGAKAFAVLRQRGRLGPVIGHPRSRRQTILTCLPDATEQYQDSLPGDRFQMWIEPPQNGFLPAMGLVISAVLGVLWR